MYAPLLTVWFYFIKLTVLILWENASKSFEKDGLSVCAYLAQKMSLGMLVARAALVNSSFCQPQSSALLGPCVLIVSEGGLSFPSYSF